MEPGDLTVRILQEIREDIRGLREESRQSREEGREDIHGLREEMRQSRDETAARFEVIETTLRDLAEQLVMLGRGIKVAIEQRATVESRIDDLERRVGALERR